MKKFGNQVSTFLFEDYLVLGLEKKWLEVFGELPKFESMLDKNGRLILKSTKSISYTKSIK